MKAHRKAIRDAKRLVQSLESARYEAGEEGNAELVAVLLCALSDARKLEARIVCAEDAASEMRAHPIRPAVPARQPVREMSAAEERYHAEIRAGHS